MADATHIGQLILAAGSATRMGRPKQLLRWQGETLLERAIRIAVEAEVAERIVVVLGANYPIIKPTLRDISAELIYHPQWEKGMSSSLQAGLQHLLADEGEWDGVMVTLVDQPLVETMHLQQLYQVWQNGPFDLAAARYSGTLGVPAVFGRQYFADLLALKGATGARSILMQKAVQLSAIDLPQASLDMDTPEDWQRFTDMHK